MTKTRKESDIMERIAIISDVHGNITALKAVMEDIDNKGIKEI